MGQLLYENFDELTPPALPGAGQGETVTAVVGSWVTGTHAPVSGANDLENSSPADDNFIAWTSPASATNSGFDQCVQFTQLVQISGSDSQLTGILFRLSGAVAGATGYLIDPSFRGNTVSVFRRAGASSYSAVGSAITIPSFTNGAVVILKAQVQTVSGNAVISVKIWQHGTSEPASWTGTVTDTAPPAAYLTGGTAWGLRTGVETASTGTWTAIDDLFFGDPDTTFGPWGTSYTNTPPNPASGYAGKASGNFTLEMVGGPVAATTTFTPSDGGLGGTFTPSTVQITVGNSGPVTYTYTPPVGHDGAITISVTSSPALTNPANVTYASNAPVTTISPLVVAPSTTGAVLTLTGTGTTWSTNAPNWTVAAGVTITGHTVTNDTSMTLTVNASSAEAAYTFTNTVDNSTFTLYVSTTTTVVSTAELGTANSGRVGTVGFTIVAGNGSIYAPRTTAGISEMAAGTGDYIANLTVPTLAGMGVIWDSGGADPTYSSDDINPAYT